MTDVIGCEGSTAEAAHAIADDNVAIE